MEKKGNGKRRTTALLCGSHHRRERMFKRRRQEVEKDALEKARAMFLSEAVEPKDH